jgi:hypothetical protein
MRNIDMPEKLVCRQGHDPDIWHEDNTEAKAISLCTTGAPGGAPCPGLAKCLMYATDPANHAATGQGVWGGVGKHRRDRIRAQRARGNDVRYPIVTFTTTDCQTPVTESSL